MQELSKSENDFLNVLFDVNSQVEITDTIRKLNPTGGYTKDKKFLLGRYVQASIKFTQELMYYFYNENARIKFLACHNMALLYIIETLYHEINDEPLSDTYIEFLDKKFYETTSLDYKSIISHREETMVINSMMRKTSLSELQDSLRDDNHATEKMLSAFIDGYSIYTINKSKSEILNNIDNMEQGIYLYRDENEISKTILVIHDDKNTETLNLMELDIEGKYTQNLGHTSVIPEGLKDFIISKCQLYPAIKVASELQKSLAKMQRTTENIIKRYKNATETEPGYRYSIAAGLLFLSLGFILVEPVFAISLIAIATSIIIYENTAYSQSHKSRNMNIKAQNEFYNSFEKNLKQLATINKNKAQELQGSLKNIRNEALSSTLPKERLRERREEKALASIFALSHYLHSQKSFKKIFLENKKEKEITKKIQHEITSTSTRTDYTPDYVYISPESCQDKTEHEIRNEIRNSEDLKNLKKLYLQYKEEAKAQRIEIQKEEKDEKIKKISAQNSYQKIVYQLSAELEKQACLVNENYTYICFDLGKYKEKLNKENSDVVENFIQGKYSKIVLPEGEFGGFKRINESQYELKLFDGRRVDFQKDDNNIHISANENRQKFVPRFVAFNHRNK